MNVTRESIKMTALIFHSSTAMCEIYNSSEKTCSISQMISHLLQGGDSQYHLILICGGDILASTAPGLKKPKNSKIKGS